MIKSIKFQNFLSFYSGGEVDFAVNEHAPDTFDFMKCGGQRLSKISVILGANGSGKSNVLKAILWLRNFIVHSFSETKRENIYYNPHKAQKDQPSYFEAEFYIEQKLYKYSLKLDKERVLLEKLEHRPDQRMCLLYLRKYNASNKSYNFNDGNELKLKSDFANMVRPNASFISTGSQFNHKKLTQIKNYWEYIALSSTFLNETTNVFRSSQFYFKNKNYFDDVKKYLKQMDLGLSDIFIKEIVNKSEEDQTKFFYFPYGNHKYKNQTFEVPFVYESLGTQKLYNMLRIILPALNKGSLCIIDEIESSLHPEILPFFSHLFVSPESNPKGAQLLCTTHAPTLLNELSKYQVFLTEKNKNCESEIYRLDDLEDVRADDNLFRKYLAGAYGGVPDIDI